MDLPASARTGDPPAPSPSRDWSWLTRTPVRVGFAVLVCGLFALSFTQPLWVSRFVAPQYPYGLNLQVYLNHVEGDVQEVDILNHYVGMRPVAQMAVLERRLAAFLLAAVCLSAIVASAFRKSFWQVLFLLPLVLFPIGMLIDLYAWLWYTGHALDPTSPMSMTVKPFTPKLIGSQKIANFDVTSSLGPGTYLQIAGAVLLASAAMIGRKLGRSSARGAP